MYVSRHYYLKSSLVSIKAHAKMHKKLSGVTDIRIFPVTIGSLKPALTQLQ